MNKNHVNWHGIKPRQNPPPTNIILVTYMADMFIVQ